MKQMEIFFRKNKIKEIQFSEEGFTKRTERMRKKRSFIDWQTWHSQFYRTNKHVLLLMMYFITFVRSFRIGALCFILFAKWCIRKTKKKNKKKKGIVHQIRDALFLLSFSLVFLFSFFFSFSKWIHVYLFFSFFRVLRWIRATFTTQQT